MSSWFKKSNKNKSKKGGKKGKKEADNDDDYYRPQPVVMQRGWATGTGAKKAKNVKKQKKQHRSQNSGSGSLNKSKPKPAPSNPKPAQPSDPIESDIKSQPQSQPKQDPIQPVQNDPLKHAETQPNIYNKSNPNYDHNANAMSMDSNISSQSAPAQQSAPLYNNYNYNNQQPPPPSASAMSAYNQQREYIPKHQSQMSNKLSEGIPSTGQPEVVGDISNWKAQQQQQQQQNNIYPNLQQPQKPMYNNNNNSIGDGVPQTGGGYVPGLKQSRTSATGQNQFNGIQQYNNNNNGNYPKIRSAANDDPETIIPSQISAYNPNAPLASVPPEESSSDDDELNVLMSGKALNNNENNVSENNDDDNDDKIKQIAQIEEKKEVPKKKEEIKKDAEIKKEEKKEEMKQKEEEEEEEELEESDSDDDGGLSDWLISIGFKKKKLALMLNALSELGLDTMEDLEELLIDLYKNSYGNQQKQWMDKIQNDLISKGIKYAQWIKFSTKAQLMIESKVKNKNKNKNKSSNSNLVGGDDNDSKTNEIDKPYKDTPQGPSGFIIMQNAEAQKLEQLRNAKSDIIEYIDNLDKLVLSVEHNEKLAVDGVEKEFDNLIKQINIRKQLLISSINKVSEDKSSILGKQNGLLKTISAQYEETLHEFNSILANNQNIRGKNEITKRQNKLINLVNNIIHKYKQDIKLNQKPQCTSLIGFNCNITPIVIQLNKLGIVTWGNPPQPPIIIEIITSDWSINIRYENISNNNNNNQRGKNKQHQVAQDPIFAYEIQCVLCKNAENLLYNFEYEMNKKKPVRDKKHKKKHGVIDHGIITKQITTKSCILLGFVVENKDYVLRIRCQNRNGWSIYSKCILCKTKKKKKRKPKLINKSLKILRHRGSTQDGSPNNLLFNNEKLLYQSLSNQDFINEYTNYKRVNKINNKYKEFTDWLIFDLGTFIELITFKIKFDVLHYRWGNIPKLIYIDIANYDDHSYTSSIIKKYKPISYDDDYHNPSDPNNMSGVLVQLRKKRLEQEKIFESIWNRLAIIECKKKAGWQDFNLYENIDESKRKGQYIRIQFVNNFDCNIEHYSKFVVEQISFVGVQYDD